MSTAKYLPCIFQDFEAIKPSDIDETGDESKFSAFPTHFSFSFSPWLGCKLVWVNELHCPIKDDHFEAPLTA